MAEFFRNRLYTLYRDPITTVPGGKPGAGEGGEGGGEGAGGGVPGGGAQVPTRPFQNWMEAVNEALLALLFEEVFILDDDFLELNGVLQADGSYVVNDLAIGDADIVRFANGVDVYITGMVKARDSQNVVLVSVGLGHVFLEDQDTRSLPENGFLTTVRAQTPMLAGIGYARVYYDGTDDKWRVITHEMGGTLRPSDEFLETAFTAQGGEWTVLPSQVDTYGYYIRGAMMYLSLRILESTSEGVLDGLVVELPSEYSSKRTIGNTFFVRNNPSHTAQGADIHGFGDDVDPLTGKVVLAQMGTGGRQFSLQHMNGEPFEGDIAVLGQLWFELGSAGGDFIDGDTGPSGTGTGVGNFSVPLPSSSATIATLNSVVTAQMLAESCQNQGGNWNAMNAGLEALRATDSRWGFNGKRGNIDDPSQDVFAYYYGDGDPWVGSNQVYVIDWIIGHCGPNPTIGFGDVTDYNGVTLGAWVYPRGADAQTPPPSTDLPPISGGDSSPGSGDAVAPGSITWHAARNPSGWGQSSNISGVNITSSQTCVTHSHRNSWAGKGLSNGVVVNANAWVGIQIGGQWHMSTWEYFRPGQTCKGLQLANRAVWDDHVRSPLIGNPPSRGDTVLFMMSTIARNSGDPTNGQERSQIVSVTWPY